MTYPPFSRKGRSGRGQQCNLSNPIVCEDCAHCSAKSAGKVAVQKHLSFPCLHGKAIATSGSGHLWHQCCPDSTMKQFPNIHV